MRPEKQFIQTDVLVLGAGVAGLCTAIALAENGRSVTVAAPRNLKGEASPRAAGIIDPFLGLDAKNPLLKLTLEAYRYFPSFIRRLEKKTGMKVEYRRLGMACVALSAEERKLLRKTFEWQKRVGIPLRWLELPQLEKIIPSVSGRARGGLFYPSMGRINPILFVAACRKRAEQLGVRILRTGIMTRLCREQENFVLRAGVSRISAPSAVVAAGAWSGQCVSFSRKLPVNPVRGQIFVAESPVALRVIVHGVHDTYIVPREAGDYLLGSTVESVGYNASTTEKARKKILSKLQAIMPGLRQIRITGSWAGLRPRSSDERPLLGPVPKISGLYAATGYFRSGILLSPYCGMQLARLISKKKASPILKPFNPGRFQ